METIRTYKDRMASKNKPSPAFFLSSEAIPKSTIPTNIY